MPRAIAGVLCACLLAGCASAPVSWRDRRTPAPSLETANQELKGQLATIELASGEVIEDAQEVVIGPETTSWVSEQPRSVPTSEVRRITRVIKWRAGKGYALGLVACLPAAIVFGNREQQKGFLPQGFLAAFADAACATLGIAFAKIPRERVIYIGAGRSASSSGTGDLHCHLVRDPRPGGAWLACTP